MKRFDSKALYLALDQERRSREMSWREVSAEIGVSVSTISNLQNGGRMEVDGMLAMVSWLKFPSRSLSANQPAKRGSVAALTSGNYVQQVLTHGGSFGRPAV